MLKPFINCRAEARRSLSVGSSAATLYCGNRTCGKSDSGSWATCDNLQQPSSFQLEDKRLTHIDAVWASFKHSDLLALKSLEPLRNLRVSFAGGAYSAFSFWAYIPCHEVKPLCINKFIAIPLRSSPSIDLSYLASCRWAFKSWSCARRNSEFLVCQNWLIFRVIGVIAWFFPMRGNDRKYDEKNARHFRELLKWSPCTLLDSSFQCQVSLLRSGRAQLWSIPMHVFSARRCWFNPFRMSYTHAPDVLQMDRLGWLEYQ